MPHPLKIREYNSNDKPEVLDMLRLNVPEYFAEREINDLDEYLKHKIDRYFVIENRHRIIGAGGINFEEHNTIAKISWDLVHPEFQRKGVGKKLLIHRLNILKSIKSVEDIRVRTSQVAYKFNEKNGFYLETIVKNYWAKGFDLYDMRYK
jgi:ribosomal-protein-alanine N-acetyltransferase